MSSTVIAKNVQIGADGTASNNFTIFQPATPDGTLRIGNGNTGITSSLVTLTSAGAFSVTGTTTTTLSVAGNEISAVNSLGFRNRIINGAMVIDQRNAGAAVTTDGAFPVDRWKQNMSGGGVISGQRSTVAPAGFVNSLSQTVSTADSSIAAGDYYFLTQNIEGFNVSDLGWGTASAQSITVSFQVRSSVTGTYAVAFGNSAFNRLYVATYAVNAANTWETKTVTIAGDTSGTWLTDNGIGLRVYFDLGSGSDYNASSSGAWLGAGVGIRLSSTVNWIATNGATFYITGVQLEAGSVASPFERRDYGRELIMCQRYFETSFGDGTAPSNGSSTSFSTENGIAIGVATNRLSAGTSTSFSVKKRAQPTITTYGNSSGYWAWVSPSGTAYTFSVNVNPNRVGTGAFGFNQQVVDGALVVCFGHWTASAEL